MKYLSKIFTRRYFDLLSSNRTVALRDPIVCEPISEYARVVETKYFDVGTVGKVHCQYVSVSWRRGRVGVDVYT